MAISDDVLTTLPPEPFEALSRRVRDGDVLLCAAHDMGSKLISWSTKSQWTHIALAYRWPSLGRVMAFESVHTIGVRAVPLASFIKRTSSGVTPYPGKILLARHEDFPARSHAEHGQAMRRLGDFAVDRFGDPFASGEILKIAARLMLGGTRVRTPKRLAPKDEFICSEYVARCFSAIGIDIAWNGEGFIAPADFARDPKMKAIGRFRT
jgi:hypothetical protein